jgi:hypothetical protein
MRARGLGRRASKRDRCAHPKGRTVNPWEAGAQPAETCPHPVDAFASRHEDAGECAREGTIEIHTPANEFQTLANERGTQTREADTGTSQRRTGTTERGAGAKEAGTGAIELDAPANEPGTGADAAGAEPTGRPSSASKTMATAKPGVARSILHG